MRVGQHQVEIGESQLPQSRLSRDNDITNSSSESNSNALPSPNLRQLEPTHSLDVVDLNHVSQTVSMPSQSYIPPSQLRRVSTNSSDVNTSNARTRTSTSSQSARRTSNSATMPIEPQAKEVSHDAYQVQLKDQCREVTQSNFNNSSAILVDAILIPDDLDSSELNTPSTSTDANRQPNPDVGHHSNNRQEL